MVIRSSAINQCLGRADTRGQGKEFLYIYVQFLLFLFFFGSSSGVQVLLFSGS